MIEESLMLKNLADLLDQDTFEKVDIWHIESESAYAVKFKFCSDQAMNEFKGKADSYLESELGDTLFNTLDDQKENTVVITIDEEQW